MADSSVFGESWVNADAVVLHAYGKIACVRQTNFQLRPLRMHAGVANSLVANSVDLILNDGMHFFSVTQDRKRALHGTINSTFFDSSSKGIRQVILLCG